MRTGNSRYTAEYAEPEAMAVTENEVLKEKPDEQIAQLCRSVLLELKNRGLLNDAAFVKAEARLAGKRQ
jgi:hypothetical protein